jgi:hypothetical protein
MGLAEFVTVAVPAPVAEELIAKGLADRPIAARDPGDIAHLVVSATGFTADAISLVVAAGALKDAWRVIARALRRTPKAEKLRIQVGDHLDITVDLDWLAGQGDSVEAAVMKSIGASLIDLADRTK